MHVTRVTFASTFPGGAPDPTGSTNAVVVALDGLTAPGGEPALEQRRLSYRYDGLQRLTDATETSGTSYRYAYDRADNRTEVHEHGVAERTVDAYYHHPIRRIGC